MNFSKATVDPDIADELIRFNVSLLQAGEIVTYLRQRKLKYPIKSSVPFVRLGGKSQSVKLRSGQRFSKSQLKEFFPKRFYPIKDETDLLVKLYAALESGREIHAAEDALEARKQSISYTSPSTKRGK